MPSVKYFTRGDETMANAIAECVYTVSAQSHIQCRVCREAGGRLTVDCSDLGKAYGLLKTAMSFLVSMFAPHRLCINGDTEVTLLRASPDDPNEAAAALLRKTLIDRVECFATNPGDNPASEMAYTVSMLPLSGCDDTTSPIELNVTNTEGGIRWVTSGHLDLPPGVNVVGGPYPLGTLKAGQSLHLNLPVERGDGYTHARFRSVASVSMRDGPLGHTVCLRRLVGQLTGQECIEAAVSHIREHGRLTVDLDAEVPHTMTSDVRSLRCFAHIPCMTTSMGEHPDPQGATVDRGVSMGLHGLRQAYGEAMAGTNRGHRIRDAANPLDALDGRIKQEWGFVSRAAPKLIELVKERDILCRERPSWRIASLCEGPGSYPQWLLYHTRHHPDVTLFGFTLQGSPKDEFRLASVRGAELPTHRFIDMSGGSGDITDSWAVEEFITRVHDHPSSQCFERGVHLVTADGGLPNHTLNQDEIHTLALIAGQLAAGLAILEAGGDIICKLFLTETPAMARLLHQASECFERVELVKPLASRATNSEKYLVGTGFRHVQKARQWARGVRGALASAGHGCDKDKGAAVAAHLAEQGGVPRPFLRFLLRANTGMAKAQAAALKSLLDLPLSGASQARRAANAARGQALCDTCLWGWGLVDTLSQEPTY